MVKTNSNRACPVCGTPLAGNSESCPVCALQGALTPESGASAIDSESKLRFEHYQVLKNEDGARIELGRGAMGVTYNAVDINLRRTVALKVINAELIGDESVRRRFVREARAAAGIRHPNVASVFHLGQSGDSYFYAMEFVDGESLDKLIRRSGPLEVKLALEITTQVAAGLTAVHKQKLVHRDIKPGNIVISLEGGNVSAKIIDLGLAKVITEPQSGTVGSIAGGFAGTPEFASPEQFIGIGVDIRSDLYSLGGTLWNMIAGQPPFRGTSAELMHQHMNAALPLDHLDQVPQPVAVLVKMLLEKDPIRRFQSPAELLKAIPKIVDALKAGRTVTRESLQDFSAAGASTLKPEPLHARLGPQSVAVLPFDSLSRNQRDSYFADGIHDEILSSLARVSQLKVISRTSVMSYRAANRDLRAIARALGVANMVEGTVRRGHNRVRITIRLVAGDTDAALWSEAYDRDLTDIFAIQSEIAATVAIRLAATISPEEIRSIQTKLTDNLEAYDLYLKAKRLVEVSETTSLIDAIKLLEEALRLDPKFTSAYCLSAKAHDQIYNGIDLTPTRRAFGDVAISKALALQPEAPEVHLTYAYHLYMGYRDYESARMHLAIAKRGMPNNPEVMWVAGLMDRRQGNFERAIQEFSEAMTLDPRNPMIDLAHTLFITRQFSAAEQQYDRAIRLDANHPSLKVLRAYFVTFMKDGDDTPLRSELADIPSSMDADRHVLNWRLVCALNNCDWQQASDLVTMMGEEDDGAFAYANATVPAGCYSVLISRLRGDRPDVNSAFAHTRSHLNRKVQRSQGNPRLLSQLAVVDALLGKKHDAIAVAERTIEMLPISSDAVHGPLVLLNLAVVYTWTEELNLSFEILNTLAKTPGGLYFGQLKRDPYWEPLRKDPRYNELLAELAPKN
jgi:serine/threonine protein kinase/Tfp pilus assembly protein PilF